MSQPQLETRQLRYFLAVAEHGTLTKAADHLHIAQPSLSQAIARMEQQLGLPLFHRVGRRVVLSEAGRDLLEPCRRALRTVQAAQDAVLASRGSTRGRLVIAAMPSAGMVPGADLVSGFLRDYPAVTVSTVGAWTPEEVTTLVKQGAAEIGLYSAARLQRDKDLVVVPLGAQRLVVVSGEPDPLPNRDELTVAGLRESRLITSHPGSVMRQIVDEVLARAPESTIACEVDHRTAILPLVIAGVGQAIVPEAWEPLAERAGLRVRGLADSPRIWIGAACRRGGLSPLAEHFMEGIRDLRDRDAARHVAKAGPDTPGDHAS